MNGLAVGPDGGDARSFAADPSNVNHIYLGTTNGWVYQTEDGGASWQRLAKLSKTDDLIVDNIVVDEADPKTLYVGAWVLDQHRRRLVHQSRRRQHLDLGRRHERSIDSRSGAIAVEFQDSGCRYAAGGLSQRGWRRPMEADQPVWGAWSFTKWSPSPSIPGNPAIVYAGTWHLPWKTTDGGATWHSIKQGLIVDSDVFSIIIDPVQTNIVYTSACSGIYKSENGGELYHKVQGIPSTARRTRVLMQDPVNRNVVYAGTTEGLYKTVDGGVNWQRMTGDRTSSSTTFTSILRTRSMCFWRRIAAECSKATMPASAFKASNAGFSQRQVATLLVDGKNPQNHLCGRAQ